MSMISLLIIVLIIFSTILLSGVKIIISCKYTQIMMFFFILYGPFSQIIETYKSGYTDGLSIIMLIIVLLVMFILGYKRNKYIYSVHNVKQKDVIYIIERYLERTNIKYEIRGNEIQLIELYKVIYVKGKMEILLDCREIKDIELYNDILMEVRTEIKNINKRHFPKEAIIYLLLAVILYWIKTKFF